MKRFALCVVVVLAVIADVKAECIPCESGHQHAVSPAQVGPADPGSMNVTYCQGEFWVSVNGLNNWLIAGNGMMRPDVGNSDAVPNDIPTGPFPAILATENVNAVGEGSLGLPITYTDVYVGNILADPPMGTMTQVHDAFDALITSGQLRFESFAFGQDATFLSADDIWICPEPSTSLLCVMAALRLGVYGWRRRKSLGNRISPHERWQVPEKSGKQAGALFT